MAGGDAKSRMKIKALEVSSLRARCDVSGWRIESSDELPAAVPMLGQNRAAEALEFGATIDRKGYNLYVVSPAEAGAISDVKAYLEHIAGSSRAAPDWVYVHNFADPRRPRALKLKPGRAVDLKAQMDAAVNGLRETIPAIFASDEYQARIKAIDAEAENAIQRLQERADAKNLTIAATDNGFKIVPLRNGRQMTDAEIDALPPAERRQLELLVEEFEDKLQALIERIPEWERNANEQRRRLNEQICSHAIEQALTPVARSFGGNRDVDGFLSDVREAILDDIDHFAGDDEDEISSLSLLTGEGHPFHKYEINIMSTSGDQRGARVIHEGHPTYGRLVGAIRPGTDLSAPAYDHRTIEPGALHRANGGFLLLDVEELITMPLGWDVLKRSLRGDSLVIDTPGAWYGEYSSDGLEPEPIPLDCKIVLFGDRYLHYRLSILDNEFGDLFKVVADFADDIARTPENEAEYAKRLGQIIREDQLRPFSREALGALVEEAARQAEDAEKLSVLIKPVRDLMVEADHIASMNAHMHVTAADVADAVTARTRRVDQLRELSHEFILRDFLHIQTEGKAVGQVNGLVVTGLDHAFGKPSRITAKARMGSDRHPVISQVVDIQKEVEMGGSSHSKGMLILSGYLQSRFSPHEPLSLSATVAFEQSHSYVDGDSASCAELCALLSAIGEFPLRQDLAITGAISQHGEVMAVGGVNEKIEGFFDICKARGLTGKQGVIIPHANVKDLMLRPDVVDAAGKGEFHIFAVGEVDRALELLTGLSAGKRGRKGGFTRGSLNRMVEDRLAAFETARRRAGRPWRPRRFF